MQALNDVSLAVSKGSVHCIVGENGAGKSTFIKILTGAVRRDTGVMLLNNKDYNPRHVKDSLKAGTSASYSRN